jgi:hypothetical protein
MGAIADSTWGLDTADANTASSFSLMLKDTSAYQGAASGLTVDQIWEYDTSSISGAAAVGTMLKDTSAYQGAASGLTAGAVADAVWDEDSSGHGAAGSMGLLQASAEGSDTTAILAMLLNNWFARVTVDTPIVVGAGGQVVDDTTIGDVSYIANNPAVYKATGFASHTPDDVYEACTTGTNENEFRAVGFSNHSAADVYTACTTGTREEEFQYTSASTHSIADVYNYFVSGTNEEPFQATGYSTFDETTDSILLANRGEIAEQVADSVG